MSTYQQKECSKESAEEEGTRQIGIVHDVLVDPRDRVQYSKSLSTIVST
jgi:hypothetical protein